MDKKCWKSYKLKDLSKLNIVDDNEDTYTIYYEKMKNFEEKGKIEDLAKNIKANDLMMKLAD